MDLQNLIYMANQIARNLAAQGEAVAIAQTAQHLRDFWDPRMIAAIRALDPAALDPAALDPAGLDPAALDPIAAAAVAQL